MSKQDQQNSYIPSKYSKAFYHYTRHEIKSVVPILRSVAHSCNIAFRYPIYKVLKAVAKIFLVNEVQGIFLAYMIRETNWDITDKLISQNSDQVRDVVCCNSDHPEYKNLILYLMLATYTLKFFLNENNEQLLEEAIRICPNFKLIFQNWAKKHAALTKKINPKTLNKVYQDLYLKIRHEQPDFNVLADSILQISPAYNPEKSQKDKRFEKKQDKRQFIKETKEPLPREQPVKIIKVQQEPNFQVNPIFSQSRLYEMAGVGLNISECSNFQVFGQMQKSGNIGTRFGGSVFGSSALLGMPNCPQKYEEDYCEQLNLGLQNGQSEENIVLRDPMPEVPNTSIITLSRGFSFTQKELNLKVSGKRYQ